MYCRALRLRLKTRSALWTMSDGETPRLNQIRNSVGGQANWFWGNTEPGPQIDRRRHARESADPGKQVNHGNDVDHRSFLHAKLWSRWKFLKWMRTTFVWDSICVSLCNQPVTKMKAHITGKLLLMWMSPRVNKLQEINYCFCHLYRMQTIFGSKLDY